MMPLGGYLLNLEVTTYGNAGTENWLQLSVPILMMTCVGQARVEQVRGSKYCLFWSMRYVIVMEVEVKYLFLLFLIFVRFSEYVVLVFVLRW
jgi:hypothetical protein